MVKKKPSKKTAGKKSGKKTKVKNKLPLSRKKKRLLPFILWLYDIVALGILTVDLGFFFYFINAKNADAVEWTEIVFVGAIILLLILRIVLHRLGDTENLSDKRPWMGVIHIKIVPPITPVNSSGVLTVTMKNSGKIPAHNVQTRYMALVRDNPLTPAEQRVPYKMSQKPSIVSVMPGQEIAVNEVIKFDTTDMQQLISRTSRMHFAGVIEYTGASHAKYETTYYFSFGPDANGLASFRAEVQSVT